jgi:NADH-quinone oxidoreductase subunit J
LLARIVFDAAAIIACVFAALMVMHRNPVKSALALVVSLFALSVIYVLLSAPFIAAIQVIVYAGAILVLFLFVIMLLNLPEEERSRDTHRIQHVLGGISIVIFITAFLAAATQTPLAIFPLPAEIASGEVAPLARELFGTYLLPFEAVSVLLLAALVGALVLSRKDRP